MKKFLFIILFFFLKQVNAQTWVTIPDANFVIYLQNTIPSAMRGDSLDINNILVTSTTHTINVTNRNIANLSGLQYFSSLDTLVCSQNHMSTLPALSNSLTYLDCNHNGLINLPSLPNSLIYLDCGTNSLTSLPVLSNSLQILGCRGNNITNLPALPNSLNYLDCSRNSLTSLPTLPNSLIHLDCNEQFNGSHYILSTLPALPLSLKTLICYWDSLISLPTLPDSLVYLNCFGNHLTNLPALPDSLQSLYCNDNNITCFPVFPNSILSSFTNLYGQKDYHIKIYNNPFTCLPNYIAAMDSTTLAYPLCGSSCSVVTTNINQFLDINTIKIYPNPANNKITVDAKEVTGIKIFDVLGKEIISTKEKEIDVSNFNDGVYFIQVQTKQNTSTQKIIIQH